MKEKIRENFFALPAENRAAIEAAYAEAQQKEKGRAASKNRKEIKWPTIEDYILYNLPRIYIGQTGSTSAAIQRTLNPSLSEEYDEILLLGMHAAGSDEEAEEFSSWLMYTGRILFWPFVWDLIRFEFDIDSPIYEKRRKQFSDFILSMIGPNAHSSSPGAPNNLLFGDFRGSDFSNVTLENSNLTNATLKSASFKGTIFRGTILRNADFRGASHLDVRSLGMDNDLYQTKLPVEDIKRQLEEKKCTLSDITNLEERIVLSYVTALAAHYKISDNAQQAVVWSRLKLIQFSGFSPLEWGVDDAKFQKKFTYVYEKQEEIATHVKQKIQAILPSEDNPQGGSYYTDRLKTKDWKGVFKPDPNASRAGQIAKLQSIQSHDNLGDIVKDLTEVKAAIEKEYNLWDSELLKKINQVLLEAVSADPKPPKDTRFDNDADNNLIV